uniref:Uncharacterized protein n=1 Tax=Anguilla anguilla TaxID=7936 RepID=A0A0E9UI73_ANGAN
MIKHHIYNMIKLQAFSRHCYSAIT